jgi:hypothetical protein
LQKGCGSIFIKASHIRLVSYTKHFADLLKAKNFINALAKVMWMDVVGFSEQFKIFRTNLTWFSKAMSFTTYFLPGNLKNYTYQVNYP